MTMPAVDLQAARQQRYKVALDDKGKRWGLPARSATVDKLSGPGA